MIIFLLGEGAKKLKEMQQALLSSFKNGPARGTGWHCTFNILESKTGRISSRTTWAKYGGKARQKNKDNYGDPRRGRRPSSPNLKQEFQHN